MSTYVSKSGNQMIEQKADFDQTFPSSLRIQESKINCRLVDKRPIGGVLQSNK
jgi:hypothetical protein